MLYVEFFFGETIEFWLGTIQHFFGQMGLGSDPQNGDFTDFFTKLVFFQTLGVHFNIIPLFLKNCQGIRMDAVQQQYPEIRPRVGRIVSHHVDWHEV